MARKSRSLVPNIDGLESRALLSAGCSGFGQLTAAQARNPEQFDYIEGDNYGQHVSQSAKAAKEAGSSNGETNRAGGPAKTDHCGCS